MQLVTVRKLKEEREREKKQWKRNWVIWYLWQIRTAVKYIQILRQHTTQRKTPSFVLQLLENRIKNIHVFKEAFLFLFLTLPSTSSEGISRRFVFGFVVSAIFFPFCWSISYLKQASRALVVLQICCFWFLQSGAGGLATRRSAFLHLDVHFWRQVALSSLPLKWNQNDKGRKTSSSRGHTEKNL